MLFYLHMTYDKFSYGEAHMYTMYFCLPDFFLYSFYIRCKSGVTFAQSCFS